MDNIELKLCEASPFIGGSPMCEIWGDHLSQHYAQSAVEDYVAMSADQKAAEPLYEIMLGQPEGPKVLIGITGAFHLEDELGDKFKDSWGLRWHGLIQLYRKRGYSGQVLDALCDLLSDRREARPKLIELIPPYRQHLAHHFEHHGFESKGSLRPTHPLYPGWLIYQRSLHRE